MSKRRKSNRNGRGRGPDVAPAADAQPVEDSPTPWYTITALEPTAEGTRARIDLQGRIGWWPTTAEMFCADLAAVTADAIDVVVNSPGGDVFQGIQMYNALRRHPAAIHVEVQSVAASAASLVAQAGDTVHMDRASMMMVHEARTGVHGPADDLREAADLLDKFNTQLAAVYAAHADGTEAEWLAIMAEEQWFSGPEAVEAGLADTAEDGDDGSEALAPETFAEMVAANGFVLIEGEYRYAGRAECPAPPSRHAERQDPEQTWDQTAEELRLAILAAFEVPPSVTLSVDEFTERLSGHLVADVEPNPIVHPDWLTETAAELEAVKAQLDAIETALRSPDAATDLRAGTGEAEADDPDSAATAEAMETIRLSALEALSQ